MPLDTATIKELLAGKRAFDKATVIPQNGPLRWYDREMRCVSLGCNSPTYCKVESAPRCAMHALKELNQIAIRLTEWREERV